MCSANSVDHKATQILLEHGVAAKDDWKTSDDAWEQQKRNREPEVALLEHRGLVQELPGGATFATSDVQLKQ